MIAIYSHTDGLQFVIADHLGSTRVVFDTAGTVRNAHLYTAFGDNRPGTIAGTAQPMRYTGKILDGENGLNLYYYGARYEAPNQGTFTQIDPQLRRTPGWSPYVYTLDNPMKYADPDGDTVAFNVYQTPVTKEFGHMDLFFQSGEGKWYKYDQGNYGVNIEPSEGPPEGSLLLQTTSQQDALIASSALRSKAAHESGEKRYGEFCNNCKDAAVDVVNEARADIRIENPALTITPQGWFNDRKKATVEHVARQEGGQPADATVVTFVLPKYEIVQPPKAD